MRAGLERLCRYVTRHALAVGRRRSSTPITSPFASTPLVGWDCSSAAVAVRTLIENLAALIARPPLRSYRLPWTALLARVFAHDAPSVLRYLRWGICVVTCPALCNADISYL